MVDNFHDNFPSISCSNLPRKSSDSTIQHPFFSAGNALVERFAPAGGREIGKRRPFFDATNGAISPEEIRFLKKAVRATKSFSGYL